MNEDNVLVWIQIGATLFQVAKGAIGDVRQALSGAAGVEADNAALDAVHADYVRRIEAAKLAAAGE